MVNDTIAFVKKIITTELNSATDNPVSFDCVIEFQLVILRPAEVIILCSISVLSLHFIHKVAAAQRLSDFFQIRIGKWQRHVCEPNLRFGV